MHQKLQERKDRMRTAKVAPKTKAQKEAEKGNKRVAKKKKVRTDQPYV